MRDLANDKAGRYRLYGRAGWGSVLIEAQLVWYGIEFDFETVEDLFESAAARENLGRVNPLHQIPTLVAPDGAVMTESAAITLWLAEQNTGDTLAPPPRAADRWAFLRWLVFLVANVYPTFTYADDPSRFVPGTAAQDGFAVAVEAYLKRLWIQVEAAAGTPWFLGERFSALDIYIAAMTRWRPRRAWFEDACPGLAAIAAACDEHPRLAEVWRRNLL